MTEEPTKTFPITVKLSPQGDAHSFTSIENLEEFLLEEKNSFNWINAGQIPHDARERQFKHRDELNGAIHNFKGTSNLAEKSNQLVRIENLMAQRYQNAVVSHVTPQFKYVLETQKEFGSSIAAEVLSVFQCGAPSSSTPNGVMGAVLTESYRLGLKGNVQSEREALASLRRELRAEVEQRESEFKKYTESFAEWNRASNSSLDSERTRFQGLFEGYEKDFSTTQNKFETEHKELTKHYNEQLALRAPVKYWTARATTHTVWAFIFSILAILSIAGFSIGLYTFTEHLVNKSSVNIASQELKITPIPHGNHEEIAGRVAPASISGNDQNTRSGLINTSEV